MCYGDEVEVFVEAEPAGTRAGAVGMMVIMGSAPQGLFLRGVTACAPYTGLKSMIGLTNVLVTADCTDQSACNPIRRLVFDNATAYHIDTIQEVQTVHDLFLPLVQQSCSGELCP